MAKSTVAGDEDCTKCIEPRRMEEREYDIKSDTAKYTGWFKRNILQAAAGLTFKMSMRFCLSVKTVSVVLAGNLHNFSKRS